VARPERSPHSGDWLLVLLSAALLTLALLDRPGLLLNSDSLVASDFAWELGHGHWRDFQLPAVPSLFPDLAATALVQPLLGWRTAMAALVFLIFAGLLFAGSRIAAELSRTRSATVCFCVLAVAATGLGLATVSAPSIDLPPPSSAGDPAGIFPFLYVALPLTHGGPFVLGLLAALFAVHALERPGFWRLAGVAGLAWGAVVSDLLSLVSLVLPLSVSLWCHPRGDDARLRVGAALWIGAVLGVASLMALNHLGLPAFAPSAVPTNLRVLAATLPRHPELIATIVLFAALTALLPKGRFWFAYGVTAALGSLAATALVYWGRGAFRYGQPFLWWTVIFLAAFIAPFAEKRETTAKALGTGLAAAALFALAAIQPRSPNIFRARLPLIACLDSAGARAGLANYWLARETAILSDRHLQVEQVAPGGDAYLWQNNPYWYGHDRTEPSRPPDFRFILLDGLDPDRIASVYGRPERVLDCPGSEVWVYGDGATLRQALFRASPGLR
jgi:hypothetical protein